MARLGRIVAAGFPHHVTQRGNRRQTILFEPAVTEGERDNAADFAQVHMPCSSERASQDNDVLVRVSSIVPFGRYVLMKSTKARSGAGRWRRPG